MNMISRSSLAIPKINNITVIRIARLRSGMINLKVPGRESSCPNTANSSMKTLRGKKRPKNLETSRCTGQSNASIAREAGVSPGLTGPSGEGAIRDTIALSSQAADRMICLPGVGEALVRSSSSRGELWL